MPDYTCFNERDRMDMAIDRISFLQETVAAIRAEELTLTDRGLAGFCQILDGISELLEVRVEARAA